MTESTDPSDTPEAASERAAEIARREARRKRISSALPFVAAFCALIVLSPMLLARPKPEVDKVERGQRAIITLSRSEDAQPLDDAAVGREGDRLQLAFRAPGLPYGVFYSVDGDGDVHVHHRFDGDAAREDRVVDAAYALGDGAKLEVFHLIASMDPFDIDALLDVADDGVHWLNGPPLPPGAHADRFVIKKVEE